MSCRSKWLKDFQQEKKIFITIEAPMQSFQYKSNFNKKVFFQKALLSIYRGTGQTIYNVSFHTWRYYFSAEKNIAISSTIIKYCFLPFSVLLYFAVYKYQKLIPKNGTQLIHESKNQKFVMSPQNHLELLKLKFFR